MVARILVAVLLSLAGAPVLQADSLGVLNDFCEGERLLDAAYERWAEDLPEGNGNWTVIEMHRFQVAQRGPSGVSFVCRTESGTTIIGWRAARAEAWTMHPSTVPMLDSVIAEVDGMARVKSGLKRQLRNDRFMSVETLVLFTKSKIHFTRAFLGALDVMREKGRD